MRTGYAIRMRYNPGNGYLHTRVRVDGVSVPVSVWGDDEGAMEFHSLKDARAMLKVIRREQRRPEKVNIIDNRGRIIE